MAMAPDRLQLAHRAVFQDRNSQADNGEAGGVLGVRAFAHIFSLHAKKGGAERLRRKQ